MGVSCGLAFVLAIVWLRVLYEYTYNRVTEKLVSFIITTGTLANCVEGLVIDKQGEGWFAWAGMVNNG